MGFVERFAASFGFGTAEVLVTLDEPERAYSGGDVIRGLITLRGGKVNQKGALSVSLHEHWVEMMYNGTTPTTVSRYKTYNETLIAEDVEVAAGEAAAQEFRFALTMVPDANLAHEWGVSAVFQSPSVAESVGRATFRIEPPPVVTGLIAAINTILPSEVYEQHNAQTCYILGFRPTTSEGRERFDALHFRLDLDRTADTLNGEMTINPQEHTLGEHLQSLLQLNNRKVEVRLTASDVEKGPESEAVNTLRSLLHTADTTASGDPVEQSPP